MMKTRSGRGGDDEDGGGEDMKEYKRALSLNLFPSFAFIGTTAQVWWGWFSPGLIPSENKSLEACSVPEGLKEADRKVAAKEPCLLPTSSVMRGCRIHLCGYLHRLNGSPVSTTKFGTS